MEDLRYCVSQIRSLSDQGISRDSISLLTRIFQKIASNPGVEKFRSIKLSNEKFKRFVWDIEPAQFLLLIIGFQTDEANEVVFLPVGIDVSVVLSLLNEQTPLVPPQRPSLKLSGIESSGNVFTNPTIPVAGPPPVPSSSSTTPRGGLLVALMEMGYSSELASQALIQTNNTSVERAIDWIKENPHQATPSTASSSAPLSSVPLVSRYQETAGERYAFLKKQREGVLKEAIIQKRESARARENLMKNMESDKKHQEAIRASNQRSQPSVQLPTHSQAKLPCVDLETAGQVSIRIRLPNGSQNIIKMQPESKVHELYRQVCNISELNIEDISLSIPFSDTSLEDHSLLLRDCSLGQGGNILVQLTSLRGQVLAGDGRVYPTIVFTSATDHGVELANAPPETLVVLMCTSSGSKASKEFEGVFDSINADLGMNREIIFMKVDLQAIPLLRGLQGHQKLPCFHFYKNSQLIFSFSTHKREELFDKIVYLKDKDADSLEAEREKSAARMPTQTQDRDSDQSNSDSEQDDTSGGGAQIGTNDPR